MSTAIALFMNEAQLQSLVITEAQRLSLLIFHSADSRRDIGAGFPDLVVVGCKGVLWRELKTEHQAPTGAQITWKYRLLGAGENWSVWTPADWRSGRISRELAQISYDRAGEEAS